VLNEEDKSQPNTEFQQTGNDIFLFSMLGGAAAELERSAVL